MLTKSEAISQLNQLGAERQPFSFYCDFLGENWCVDENSFQDEKQLFQLEIGGEFQVSNFRLQDIRFKKHPVSFNAFEKTFNTVVQQINIGNSFLTNLTFQTPVETNLSLQEIFQYSQARYKLLVPNQFVVFSPETFVKIEGNHIFSCPMKGTMDASIPNAKQLIREDTKEKAEHVTIVDLIRNDLSQVAEKVEVTRFRYIDQLITNDKKLLQVSSEVKGLLDTTWKENLGTVLSKLLPAGSVSGAPKTETVKIINETESCKRGFYTGICGHFDGQTLDTGVMIRFIRQQNDQLVYCSGGGITSLSEAQKEYEEMVSKVYLPL